MSLGERAKAAWPLKAVTLKWQAVITQGSGKTAGGKASLKPATRPQKLQSLTEVLEHYCVFWG